MTKNNKLLIAIIIVGFVLRIDFSLQSDHIFYPDEIFQTLEISYRIVTGYGIIPWDFAYGLRSFFLPFLLALPLKLFSWLNLLHPSFYIPAMKIMISSFSLIFIPTAFAITKKFTKSAIFALVSAWSMAIWYELIYFAPRALTETFSAYFFSAALLALIQKTRHFFILGLFLTMATLLRPQYFPITLVFLVHLYQKGLWKNRNLVLGAATSLSLFAISDMVTYGFPLIHLYQNWLISFQAGISQIFGTEPPLFYLSAFFSTSLGLTLISLLFYNQKYKTLYLAFALTFLLHSLISHKEYRFVFVLIPLGLTMLSISLYKKFITRNKKSDLKAGLTLGLIITLFSWWGSQSLLPSQTLIYPQPFLMKDGYLQLIKSQRFNPQPCGIYANDRSWVYTGGYYYLGANMPYYSYSYPPSSREQFNLEITGGEPSSSSTLIAQANPYDLFISGVKQEAPRYRLFYHEATCSDSSIDFYRSFNTIEELLSKKQFKPILKPNLL